jgi:hypothetical protein
MAGKDLFAQKPEGRDLFASKKAAAPIVEQKLEQEKAADSNFSAANVARQTLGQGLALGFGDEIEGFFRGIYEAATSGKSYDDAVNEGIEYARSQNKAFETQNPGSALAMQVGGGLLTGFAGGGRALAAKGLSMGAKAAKGSWVGAKVGGTTGAGMAEGGITDRALPAAMGAALGAGAGAVLPLAMAGGAKVLSPLGRMIPGGARRQAEGLFRNTADEDAVTSGTLRSGLDDIGPHGVVADVGGQSTKDLARFTGNKFGGKSTQEMLETRHLDQGPRVAASVDKNIAEIPLDDYMVNTTKLRQTSANKNYGELYEAEVPLTDKLKGFFQNESIKEAYESARDIAKVNNHILTPLSQKLDEGVAFLKPNMRTLDYIKQSLDDKVSEAFRAGKNKLGAALQSKRDEFRQHIDEISPKNEKGISLYKNARSEYAGHSAALESAELGAKFISSPKSVSIRTIKEMGDHEHESFLVGVAESLRYKVLSAPDAADVTKRIFGNHLIRQRLKAAFRGNEKAYSAFEKTIKNEAAMAETNAAVRFGSRTAPMMSDEATISKAADAVGDAVGMASGYPGSATRLGSRMVDALSTPPEAVAKHLSGMLLSQDPAKKAMAIKLLEKGQTATSRAGEMTRALLTPAASYLGARSAASYLGEK